MFKNSKKFEIYFEKDDDIIVFDKTTNQKYKIQIKTSSLSPKKICKETNRESILDKLFSNKNYYKHVLGFPLEKASKDLKKVIKETENNSLGKTCYNIDKKITPNYIKDICENKKYDIDNFYLQEFPFSKEKDNAFRYLIGYAASEEDEEKIFKISDTQLTALLGSVYTTSTKESKKYLTEQKIKEVADIMEENRTIDIIIDSVLVNKFDYLKIRIKDKKANFRKQKILIDKELKEYDLEYQEGVPLSTYFEEKINLLEKIIEKKYIDIYMISWYLIYKIIDEFKEEKEDGYIN